MRLRLRVLFGVFQLRCCERVSIEGGKRKTERHHHTEHCVFCRVTTAGAAEILKSEGGGWEQFLIKRCGKCHTQTITMDSPSFVLVDCWPMSLSTETLCVFPLTNLLSNLISILLSSPFFPVSNLSLFL